MYRLECRWQYVCVYACVHACRCWYVNMYLLGESKRIDAEVMVATLIKMTDINVMRLTQFRP
jgi:hypothetical protein